MNNFLSLTSLFGFPMDIDPIWVIFDFMDRTFVFFQNIFSYFLISIHHLICLNFKTTQENTLIIYGFDPYSSLY